MNKNLCITVVGNPGTGKSTFVEWLTNRLQCKQIPADSLFQTNPFFPLALKDRKRWSLASDIWFLSKRVGLYKKLPRLIKKSHVVIDSGLPMSYVYSHSRLESGFFTVDEWALYQQLYTDLTKRSIQPHLIIYLQLPVSEQRNRILTRGREFEKTHHTEEYLSSLQHSLEHMISLHKEKGIKILTVDTTRDIRTDEEYQAFVNTAIQNVDSI